MFHCRQRCRIATRQLEQQGALADLLLAVDTDESYTADGMLQLSDVKCHSIEVVVANLHLVPRSMPTAVEKRLELLQVVSGMVKRFKDK